MITHKTISHLFQSAVQNVTVHIRDYSVHPEKDFSRTRKFPADKLIRFLVAEGSSSTRVELLDFFGFDPDAPTSSAFRQQRAKLRPEAIKEVLDGFNTSLIGMVQPARCAAPGYRCLAADGSTASFYSTPRFSPDSYFVSEGHSMKGFYSIHVNGLFNIDRHLYMDALLQPIHGKDEFRAFCTMVDRMSPIPETSDIYIGDRGYCSYNNMAHVIEKRQYFLFRSKDVLSKGILKNLGLPTEGGFDQTVTITITVPTETGFCIIKCDRAQNQPVCFNNGFLIHISPSVKYRFLYTIIPGIPLPVILKSPQSKLTFHSPL